MDRPELSPAPRGLRIGLTGGIGSGKSTVARRFAALGARVVDTDALAHALTAPGGAAIPAIAAAFGPEAIGPDGAMDRGRMRALVFAQPEERRRLEAILHPMIGTATQAEAASAAPGQPVVFDVPLLAESGTWRARVDRVCVVDCAPATQVERVVRRSGWTPEAVERTIAQQASRRERRAIADAVIVNEDIGLVQLEAAVDRLWAAWTRPAAG
ncbi:MAG TPA: dephospho-CoA kinase [Burkholderiaceae bacterium]